MSFAHRRQLAALKASQSKQQHRRSNDEDEDEDEEHEEELLGDNSTIDEQSQRKKLKQSHPSAVANATSTTEEVTEEGVPVLVSDASEQEQAALASMFPSLVSKPSAVASGATSIPLSFGATRPIQSVDLTVAHQTHARKDINPPIKSMVKIEGAPTSTPSQQQQLMKPKKVAIPIAPASLLGSSYDSDSDDEEHEAKNGPESAAALNHSSTSAASASIATGATAMSTDDDDDEDADGSDVNRENPLLRSLPISHEAELRTNGHTKTVSALCLDRSGGRVLSGGYDYQCKQWDFGGMNETLAAFRTFEPQEGHQVRQCHYSPSGDMFLVVTGSAQPKVYNRDAVEICQFARGDMYLMDQKLTKGHSTPVTSGWWHPKDRYTCVTSGVDGTVRIWDINQPTQNLSVIKLKGLMRGISIGSTAFSSDGRMIAAACSDGSIHLLKHSKGSDYRDDKSLSGAHVKGTDTTSLLFSSLDPNALFSRGGDGDHTLKQWDIRAFRQPIHIVGELENAYPETDMCFSPDEKVIVTGTSSRDQHNRRGEAIFIERSTMKPIQRVSFGGVSIIRSCWHPQLNQLLFGCSDGGIRLLYDPQLSSKGALLCITRKAKPKPLTDYSNSIGHILTPHALPSLQPTESRNRKRARENTSAAMIPDQPIVGNVGVGGRAAGSQSMAAFHLSKYVQMKEDPRAKDPREALLAMDELTKKDPRFFNAYRLTQPVTILAEVPESERIVAVSQEEHNLANKKEGEIGNQGETKTN